MIEQRLSYRLMRYWESLCNGKVMPPMQRFQPAAIDDMQQQCFSVTIVKTHGKPQFRYMFAGEEVKKLFGRDPTGEIVTPVLPNTPIKKLLETMQECLHKPVARLVEGKFLNSRGHMTKYRACLLPFGSDGENVTHFVVGLSWQVF